MTTIQIDIKETRLNTFLTILKSLKDDIIDNVTINNYDLDIESIDENDSDFLEIMKIKEKNNKKYSLNDAKNVLGL